MLLFDMRPMLVYLIFIFIEVTKPEIHFCMRHGLKFAFFWKILTSMLIEK